MGDGQCCKGGGPTAEGATASVARAEAVAVTAAGATTSAQRGRRLAGRHLVWFLHCWCEVASNSIVLAFLAFLFESKTRERNHNR